LTVRLYRQNIFGSSTPLEALVFEKSPIE